MCHQSLFRFSKNRQPVYSVKPQYTINNNAVFRNSQALFFGFALGRDYVGSIRKTVNRKRRDRLRGFTGDRHFAVHFYGLAQGKNKYQYISHADSMRFPGVLLDICLTSSTPHRIQSYHRRQKKRGGVARPCGYTSMMSSTAHRSACAIWYTVTAAARLMSLCPCS